MPSSRLAALLFALLLAALAVPGAAAAAGRAATRAELAHQMARVGGASGAVVLDLDSGEELYAKRPTVRRTPASVEKLYTTSTMLRRLGVDTTLDTQLLAAGEVDSGGRLEGDLVLKGAGDPTLSSTALATAARDLVSRTSLVRVQGGVVGDESTFDALRGPPSSRYETSAYVGPLSALGINRGVTGVRSPYFQTAPATFAAQALQRALRRAGVKFARAARSGTAPVGAVELATIASPPLSQIVARTNGPSDNHYAETLIKLLGARLGTSGSTQAGARVVRATLVPLGLRPKVVDGSGLSRTNATSPREVVGLLRAMADDPAGSALSASLPLAGRSGTLVGRMRGTPAAGNCRAKTGTLSSVSALAGYCTARGGRRLAFAWLMNRVSTTRARAAQDAMTVALARYGP